MENRAEFNLNESIKNWKFELSQNSNLTKDNISELECHLLDEIEVLQKLGLNAEESILIAKNRLGHVKDLKTEYSKVNKGVYFRNAIQPYIKGVLLCILFMTSSSLVINTIFIIADKVWAIDSYINWISLGSLLFVGIIPFLFLYKKFKNQKFSLKRFTTIPILVIAIVVTKCMSFFSTLILARTLVPEDFGILSMNYSAFELLFGFLILLTSLAFFLFSKRDQKMKVAK